MALLERIDGTDNTKEKINLYNALGLEIQYEDQSKAMEAFNHAIELAHENLSQDSNYLLLLSGSLLNLGLLHRDAGDYENTLKCLHQALNAAEESGDLSQIADLLDYIGATYGRMAKYDETLKYSFRALKVAQNAGNKVLESEILNSIGYSLVFLNNHHEALSYLLQGLEIIKTSNNLDMVQNIHDSISNAYLGLGQYEKALAHCLEALELSSQIQNPASEIEIQITLAKVYLVTEEHDKALDALNKAWKLAEQYDLPREKCLAGKLFGELFITTDNLEEANKYLNISLETAQKIGIGEIIYEVHKLLSAYYKKKEDYETALHHYETYQTPKDSSPLSKALEQYRNLYVDQQIAEAKKDAEIYEKNIAALTKEIERSQKLQQELHILAVTDPLTELNNRGHFFNLAEKCLDTSIQNELPLSIIILDIDHFKLVNDKHGHRVGDQVLVEVAKRIKNSLRNQDISGRYGGEEFIVLLPETNLKAAKEIAKRLQRNISSTPIKTDKLELDIKISLGVTNFTAGVHMTLDGIIDQADEALYNAKESGRDQIKIFEG